VIVRRTDGHLPDFTRGGLLALSPRWLPWGLAVWLLLSVSLLGGAPRSCAVALAVAALLLAALFWRDLRASANGYVLFFSLLAAWTMLSALPLPCSVGRLVAPISAGIWADALAPLDAPPLSFCSLSVAPVATIQSAMNLASCGILAAVAGAVAERAGLSTVLLSLLGVVVLVALLTLVHALFDVQHLLGITSLPVKGRTGPASVLVNPNNLAGYMNLGVFSALALLGSRRPPIARALLVVAGALALATVISSGSRGGVLALGFGLVAWAFLSALRRLAGARSPRGTIRQTPFALIVVLAGVAIAALGASSELERELFGDDVRKLELLGRLAASLGRVDALGAGRGAFDSLSARLTGEGANLTHEYAENFVLSWLLEWGPWVGGAALVGLCWLLWPGRLALRRHGSGEGAWLGLVVLLLQNFADLGLELPALLGAFAVIGGGLEGSRASRSSAFEAAPRAPITVYRTALFAAVPLLLLAATVWTAASGPALSVERERTRVVVERALPAPLAAPERRPAWEAVRSGLRRFPAEPYFVLVGGWLALSEGKNALPWAAEALRRAPGSARAHVLTAEVLAGQGAVDQALLHLRHALDSDFTLTPVLASRALQMTADVRRLAAAAPAGVTGARFLLDVSRGLPASVDAREHRHLLAAAVARAPDDVRVQSSEGWALLADLRAGSAPCPLESTERVCAVPPSARQRILELAESTQGAPTCDGLRLRAALLVHEGRAPQALELLGACPSCQVPGACAKDRVEVALDHGNEEERRLALGAFRAGTCDSPGHCADAESWLSGAFARRSQVELALVHAWRAAEMDPSAARYLAAARAARAAGRAERVEVALDRARRFGGRDPELAAWVAVHRAGALEAPLE